MALPALLLHFMFKCIVKLPLALRASNSPNTTYITINTVIHFRILLRIFIKSEIHPKRCEEHRRIMITCRPSQMIMSVPEENNWRMKETTYEWKRYSSKKIGKRKKKWTNCFWQSPVKRLVYDLKILPMRNDYDKFQCLLLIQFAPMGLYALEFILFTRMPKT